MYIYENPGVEIQESEERGVALYIYTYMETTSKLQDLHITAWWHNLWMGMALFFLVGTATFGGLFGWAFTEWKESQGCHAYYANLVHLPPGSRMLDTTIVHHHGEFYLRKGAEYDKSSCEGKLAIQLTTTGHVLEIPSLTSQQLQMKVRVEKTEETDFKDFKETGLESAMDGRTEISREEEKKMAKEPMDNLPAALAKPALRAGGMSEEMHEEGLSEVGAVVKRQVAFN